jgi:aminoglycoside 6'-N-acetyltransferase
VALSFRQLQRDDFALLSLWLSRPHVEPWWQEEHDLGSIEHRYGPVVDGKGPTELFIVEQDGKPVAFVQLYLLDDNPEWKRALAPSGGYEKAVGIDYLIGEETAVGVGLGSRLIDGLVERAWLGYPGVEQVVVAVQQANRRSWRALEKAGFERVWTGDVESDEPSDSGPSYVYVRHRSGPAKTSHH